MTTSTQPEMRDLSADEIDAAAGALHVHVTGVFHFAVADGHISIGLFGHGVGFDEGEGGFTFQFD